MDRDAQRMFSRGLCLMLLGVLLSVLALLLMPWLGDGHRIAFVLSGVAVLSLAAVWTSAGWRTASSGAGEDWRAD